jgi:hypothetical protein
MLERPVFYCLICLENVLTLERHTPRAVEEVRP